MSTRATSACFSAAAHINAVWPRPASFAFASPPCASNSFITSTLPVRAAERTGLSRPALGLAPAVNSRSTIAALAFRDASPSAVTPPSSATSTLAPARMSRSAMATSLRCAAQCSAVAPSGCVRLTSIFCSSSRRTALASTRRTASIRRVSGAAPITTPVSVPISASSTAGLRAVGASPRQARKLDEDMVRLLHRQRLERQTPGHVAELLHRHPQRVQEADVQIGELRMREPVVVAAFQLIRPDDDDRELLRIVLVRIAVAAAVEEQRVVEQRSVAVRRRLQL